MRLILRIIPILFLLFSATSHGDGVWKYFINGNNINDISVQGDALWCATTTLPVLWNIRDSTYTRYTDRNLIPLNQTFVTSDTRGNIWFGFSGLLYTYPLLKRFDGKNWTTFSNSTLGLEKKSINSMLCDRKGIFWLGSKGGGILWYDGTSWGNMKPEESFSGNIQWLTVGEDSKIWLSTDNGLYTFDHVTWKRYSTTDGLADNSVRQTLFDSMGNLWLATLGGVSCYDGKTWKSYHVSDGLVSDSVNAVALDQNGRKWFATLGGVSCFDGNVWTSYKESDGLISDRVSGLAVDRDNHIWFCHKNADKGISCFDGKRIIWYTIWNSPIPSNHVESVACDRDGVIWLATDKGMARYDGNSWKLFTTKDGLAQNQVSGIYVDDQNTKWFIYNPTNPLGVTRYDGLSWKTYTTADGLRNNVVRTVAMNSDGSVWFGVRDGITLFDGHLWTTYPGNNQLLSSNIFSIAEGPDGVLWFATDRGLSKFDGQSWYTFTRDDGLSSESLQSVAVSDQGKVWCITTEGMVISFDGSVFRDHPLQSDVITSKGNLKYMTVDRDGTPWAAYIQNVGGFFYLYQYGGAAWKPFTIKNNATTIRKIVVDRNNVKWIATDGGLIAFDGIQSKQYLVEGFNINQLNTVTVDKNNVIWFSGGPNVQSYDGNTWKSYDYQTGAMAVDARSGIWIGRAENLWLYRNNQVYSYKLPVPASITSLTIDQENVKWVGTLGKGVFSFDDTTWKNFQKIDGVGDNNIISSLVDHKGVKWFITRTCLSSFDGNSWKIYTKEAGVDLFIKGMTVDRDDVKWFCAFTNIVSFDGKEWKKETQLPPDFIAPTDMAVDHNNIKWLTGFQKVMSYDGKTSKIYSYEEGLFPELSYSIGESGSVVVDMNNRK